MSSTRTQAKSNAAFVRLWTTGSRRVYAYILTLVTNRADAEDLLQEVGVAAWEKFAEFDASQDFVAWACGIAHFKVLAYFRSSKRLASLTETLLSNLRAEIAGMSDLLDRQHEAVEDCLSRLPAADRDLIRLRYTPGLTVERIAEQTGRTIAAIYKALQRTHVRLYKCASRKLGLEARA